MQKLFVGMICLATSLLLAQEETLGAFLKISQEKLKKIFFV
ncbi:MAG: hypothetical protein AABZ60_24565 [Planctomycetota bacterium]